MSKLDELIQELCPNGVPYVELSTISKGEKERNKGQKISLAFSITKDGLVKTSEYFKEATVTSEDTSNYKIVKKNWFVYSPSRIDVGSINYLKDEELVIVSPLNVVFSISEERILPQYLLYFLQSRSGTWQILTKREGIEGTGRKLLPFDRFSTIIVPLPPIEIQREVVKILDNFENLISELEAELTARKNQYDYYLDEFLEAGTNATQMRLGDTFAFQNGFAFKSSLFKDSGKAIIRIANIQDNQIVTDNLAYINEADYKENLSPYIVKPGDIVIAMSGATTGKIGVNTTPFDYYLNQRVGKFIPKENIVLNRYLYHLLVKKSKEIYAISEGGAQPNLSSEKLKKLTALIPPISEQKRIVTILDHFDALCNDISNGLPAEINARQKQYEYYRDKLLAFKQLS